MTASVHVPALVKAGILRRQAQVGRLVQHRKYRLIGGFAASAWTLRDFDQPPPLAPSVFRSQDIVYTLPQDIVYTFYLHTLMLRLSESECTYVQLLVA